MALRLVRPRARAVAVALLSLLFSALVLTARGFPTGAPDCSGVPEHGGGAVAGGDGGFSLRVLRAADGSVAASYTPGEAYNGERRVCVCAACTRGCRCVGRAARAARARAPLVRWELTRMSWVPARGAQLWRAETMASPGSFWSRAMRQVLLVQCLLGAAAARQPSRAAAAPGSRTRRRGGGRACGPCGRRPKRRRR